MPNYKVSFFFESAQQADLGTDAGLGWTETWYGTFGGSFQAAFNDQDVQKYMQLRLACMPSIYRLAFVRISNEALPRSFKVFAVTNGYGSFPAVHAAQVQCCMLLDLETTSEDLTRSVHRKFLMRGMDRRAINGNVLNLGGPSLPATWRFLDFIAGHNSTLPRNPAVDHAQWLGMRYQTTQGRTKASDIAVTVAVPNTFGFSPDIPDVAEGDRVVISGVPDYPLLNRIWKVVLQLPGQSTRLGISKRPLAHGYNLPLGGNAFAKKVVYGYTKLNQYSFIGLKNKKTGSSFRRLRGKR